MPTRVLLDECVPRQLRQELSGFEIRTVQQMGWAGVKNGALIDLAAPDFECIFTVDHDFGTTYVGAPSVGIVILAVGSTDPVKLRPHMPAVADALRTVQRGQVWRVGG